MACHNKLTKRERRRVRRRQQAANASNVARISQTPRVMQIKSALLRYLCCQKPQTLEDYSSTFSVPENPSTQSQEVSSATSLFIMETTTNKSTRSTILSDHPSKLSLQRNSDIFTPVAHSVPSACMDGSITKPLTTSSTLHQNNSETKMMAIGKGSVFLLAEENENHIQLRLHHLENELTRIKKIVDERSKQFQYYQNQQTYPLGIITLGDEGFLTREIFGEDSAILSAFTARKEEKLYLKQENQCNIAMRLNHLVNKLNQIEKKVEEKNRQIQYYMQINPANVITSLRDDCQPGDESGGEVKAIVPVLMCTCV